MLSVNMMVCCSLFIQGASGLFSTNEVLFNREYLFTLIVSIRLSLKEGHILGGWISGKEIESLQSYYYKIFYYECLTPPKLYLNCRVEIK